MVFDTGVAQTSRILIFEIETGEVRELIPSGNQPRYVSTGHLLYGHGDGALMGVPFDLETLQVTGAPVTLLPSLAVFSGGSSQFAVSQTGTLVYRTGGSGTGPSSTPVWVERDGTAREIHPGWSTPGNLNSSSLTLSPNGDRLAISIPDSGGRTDLWVKQLDQGPLSRITNDGTRNRRPVWSPDGRSLTFLSNREGQEAVWTRRADASGSTDLVLRTATAIEEISYSRDGTWLVYRDRGVAVGGGSDIFAVRVGTDSVPVPVAVSEFMERSPALSPDGRWVAYVSNESGQNEIYVRPFPDAESGLRLVSTAGGAEPVWAHSGRELFYRNAANELVAVQVRTDSVFEWDSQDVLFSMAEYQPGNTHPVYDVRPDDQRFVMLRMGNEGAASAETYIVTNWFEEPRQRMGN